MGRDGRLTNAPFEVDDRDDGGLAIFERPKRGAGVDAFLPEAAFELEHLPNEFAFALRLVLHVQHTFGSGFELLGQSGFLVTGLRLGGSQLGPNLGRLTPGGCFILLQALVAFLKLTELVLECEDLLLQLVALRLQTPPANQNAGDST